MGDARHDHVRRGHHVARAPIPVADCVVHPEWDSAGIDLAACTLPVAVHHVPIAPLLAGCEVDALQPGTVVTIVGFGATAGFQTPRG